MLGGPIPVVEGVLRSGVINGSSTGNFEVATNGTLVYVPGSAASATGQRVIAIVDRSGKSETLRLPAGSYDNPRVSWDGKQLALSTSDDGLNTIWFYDLSGATSLRKLTLDGSNTLPRWSPDGKIAFQSTKAGKLGIFLGNSDGTGVPENLTISASTDSQLPWSFDPTGKTLVFSNCKNFSDCGVFSIPLSGERKIQTLGG